MARIDKLGYSDKALKALMAGQYDQLTGRDPGLRSARDQLSLVPALAGMNTQKRKVTTSAPKTTQKRSKRPSERGHGTLYDFASGMSKNAYMKSAEQNIQTAEDLNKLAEQINLVNAMQNDPRYQVEQPKSVPNVFGQPTQKKEKKEKDSVLAEASKTLLPTAANTNSAMKNDPRYAVAPKKPSTRYSNENIKAEEPTPPGFSKEMAKDFEDFFDWRYNKADVRDYDPETDTEQEHWRNVQKDLMKKYKMSEDEFNNIYGVYDNYRWKKEAAEELSGNLALAEEHPILGTAASYLYNLESVGEGLDTALHGVIGDENYNKLKASGALGYNRDYEKIGTKSREGMRQNAKDDLNGVGQFAYDMGTGLGDMGVNLALSGGNKIGMGIVSGSQNAARNEQHALERGVDADKAAKLGAATGAVSGVMNTIGLDAVLKSTGNSAIGAVLKAANREGLENVAEDIADRWLDEVINRENSEKNKTIMYYMQNGMSEDEAYKKSFLDFLRQELVSYGSGAAFGGLLNGFRNAPNVNAEVQSKLTEAKLKNASDTVKGIVNGDITSVDQIRVPDVVQNAQAQAERAQANIENLRQQIPAVPEVTTNNVEVPEYPTMSRAQARAEAEAPAPVEVPEPTRVEVSEPDVANVEPEQQAVTMPARKDGSTFSYADVNEVNERLQKTQKDIQRLDERIAEANKKYEETKDIKKNAGKRAGLSKTAYELGADKKKLEKTEKILQKIADGKKVAVKDVVEVEYPELYDTVYGRNGILSDIAITRKFAGDTDEAKQLAQEARDSLYRYLKGGAQDDFFEFQRKCEALDNLAQEVNADYVTTNKKGEKNTYHYNDYFVADDIDGTEYPSTLNDRTVAIGKDAQKINQIARSMASNAGLEGNPRITEAVSESAPKVEAASAMTDVETDQQRLNDLIASKRTGNIETSNGQIFEKYTLKDMRNVLNEIKENGGLADGEHFDILYKDGTELRLGSEDDLSNVKLNNVEAIVWSNVNTDAVYGDVSIYPYEGRWYAETGQVPDSYYNTNAEVPQEVNNVPAEQPDVVNEVPQEVTNEVQNAEIPQEEAPPSGNDDIGESRVVTHSAENADIISEYEYDNDPELQEIAKYAKHHNETTYENAVENVKKNRETLLRDYVDGTRVIDNDQDVDQSMILLRELSERLRNGDESVRAQRNLLLHRLRQAGTKWGQSVQAFAKWNQTAEGAEINGKRILAGRTKEWEGEHKSAHEANEKVAEDLTNITNGANYKPPVEADASKATSSKLDAALRKQGYDNSMESAPKEPKTHEQHRVEVENSIKKELGSVAKILNDNDYEVLTNFVENGVSVDQLADEISHRLNHGTWYTIDESTPVKKQTSSKLASVFSEMGNDARKEKNRVPETGYPKKSHATIVNEVRNTLEGEPSSLGLGTDTDVEFMATMLEEGVPKWQMEDEIRHRLETGEWYSLDESIEEPKVQNQMIRNALDSLVAEEDVPQQTKPELTHEELCQQIRNTLNNENASSGISRLYTDLGEFTDADIDYLAYMIENGATKAEIAHALDTKLACGTFDISLETQNKVNLLFEEASKYDPNSRQACEAKAMAYKLIADEVVGDATALEKFDAWRYLAMLGNPKTMLRNFVGNTLFNVTTGTSNSLAAILETGTDYGVKGTKWALNKMFKTNFDTSKGIERRKALLMPTKNTKNLVQASLKDADEHMYAQLQGEKYEKGTTQDKIRNAKSVFNSGLVRAYEAATDAGISDSLAVKTKYSTSLAGYLKANGYDESIFDLDNEYRGLQDISRRRLLTDTERARMEEAKQAYDVLEKGRKYALEQAEYATFHEDNEVAKILTKWSMDARSAKNPVGRSLGYMLEGAVPFKKTPANILRSGADFSPLGAIKAAIDTGRLIWENTGKRKVDLDETYTTKNKLTGRVTTRDRMKFANVLDDLSKSITGTGLMALGYYLRNKGVLNSSSEDEKYQDQLEGVQNYSLTIGGKTYTMDWAAPAVMPMIMGAELSKIKEKNSQLDKNWYENWDEIAGTVNALFEPMVETSMLQGVKNTLESAANEAKYGNGAGGILGSVATNLATNYVTQALPTASGQIARTVDPYRRSTDTSAKTNVGAGIERQFRKLMNKIPGLSTLNQKYVDAYGREQMNSPSFGLPAPTEGSNAPLVDETSRNKFNMDLLYQSLSPAYIADVNQTDADRMARDVYSAPVEKTDKEGNKKMIPQMDADVFAKWKSKVSVGDHKFTPEEMYQYRTASGQANYAIRDALSKEEWFKNLSGDRQADLLKKVNNLVDKIGKEAVGYKQNDDALDAYNAGGNNAVPSLIEYYKDKEIKGSVADQVGMKSNSKAVEEIAEQVASGNQAKAEEMMDEATQLRNKNLGYADQYSIYQGLKGKVPQINNVNDYANFYQAIDGSDGSKKNSQLSQGEFTAYLNKYGSNMTQAEADTYCEVLANVLNWKKKDGRVKKVRKNGNEWELYYPELKEEEKK